MKRKFMIFLTCAVISCAFLFSLSSCKSTEYNMGTLTITALKKDSTASAQLMICIAVSRENLDSKTYKDSSWTNSNSAVIFRDLQPGYYWYRVKGWDDYGASEVFSGFDESVILWLNSPSKP